MWLYSLNTLFHDGGIAAGTQIGRQIIVVSAAKVNCERAAGITPIKYGEMLLSVCAWRRDIGGIIGLLGDQGATLPRDISDERIGSTSNDKLTHGSLF